MSQEIRTLAASGNRKLVLHALQRWERECPRDPEPLFSAVKGDDPEVLKIALPMVRRFFPAQFATHVLELLYHTDFLHRRLGVETIEPSMGKDASGCLYQLLQKETHPHVLASAVQAAPRLGLTVDAIVDFLKHPDPRVRANTIKGIAAFPGDHRTLLEPFLKDPILRVQNEAIKALARLVPEKRLEELLAKRLQSPKGDVRAATAMLIADLPISTKVAWLQPLLTDPDHGVISCAARALVKGNDPTGIRTLAESYFSPSTPLGDPDDPNPSVLLKLLRSCPPQPILLEAGKQGEPARVASVLLARVLFIGLGSPSWEAYFPWAQAALSRREDDLRLLGFEFVRRNAGALADRARLLEEAIEEGLRSKLPDERAMVARVCLRFGRLQGMEVLTAMLRDPEPQPRLAASRALHRESSLLARKALQEARATGIREAFPEIAAGSSASRGDHHPSIAPQARPVSLDGEPETPMSGEPVELPED